MLIQTASGLERLMAGSNKTGIMKDSNVAQISAALYYQANVIAKLESSRAFKNKFQTVIFNQIDNDFSEYIDAQARVKPKSLHHVYEWKKSGNKNARLFKLNRIDGQGLSFKLDYEFKTSKSVVPNKISTKRYIFANKASIMEAGMPVKIAPRLSKRLVFEIDGILVFMPKGASVTVKRPGGSSVKNSFTLAYAHFFSGQLVNESIKRSGFQRIFNSGMAKALKLPSDIKTIKYSFSANKIRTQATAQLEASFGGAML